jgi:hypothetical protein
MMIPNASEKRLISRLRQGGFHLFGGYSDNEVLLWKPRYEHLPFSWRNTILFYIHRSRGCHMEFRPQQNPSLHLHWDLSWPDERNWREIADFEEICERSVDLLSRSPRAKFTPNGKIPYKIV